MKKFLPALIALVVLALPRFTVVTADEGMWVPPAIGARLPMETLKKMGFELSREELWSAGSGSLRGAFLQVGSLDGNGGPLDGYGSASFVSSKGLIVTNHHVAYDALTGLSTPEENFVEQGFRAETMADERPCEGLGVRITTLYDNVTEQVIAGVEPGSSEADRNAVIAENSAKLIAAAEANGFQDVKIEEMLHGLAYYIVAYDTFRDVRMVYAPPRAIGEYGGDIDNWMWPRHTGDFTFMRAYVAPDGSRAEYAQDNVPYEPESFLKISLAGIKEGDFTFIMGYPGSTSRHESSFSFEQQQKFLLPTQVKFMNIMAEGIITRGKDDEAFRIKASSDLKSINNTIKNFEGKIEGLKRTQLVAKTRAREAELTKWIQEDEKRVETYGDPIGELAALYANAPTKSNTLQALTSGAALILFMDASIARLEGRIPAQRVSAIVDQVYGPLVPEGIDAQRKSLSEALVSFWNDADSWRPEAMKDLDVKETTLDDYVASLLPEPWSRETVAAFFTQGERVDTPLATLGRALASEVKEANEAMNTFAEDAADPRRRMVAAMEAWTGAAIYPDANLTIRFTYGKVRGYAPRDGVSYDWYTTAEGITEKHSGIEPFIAPDRVRELVAAKDWGRYADKKLGRMVVNFLSDNDITGGNSGSPIMNGKGEMIGLAFDGNYEAMTSDYQFEDHITRTINVDIRYVLWCADKVDGMKRLIDEMTIVGAPK